MTPAILIVHYKNSPHTPECLDSLQTVKSPYVTYILSIQSSDSELLKTHPIKPHVITTKINGGFAWANNQLIKQALADGRDSVILLNNDTTVDQNFITPLVAQLNNKNVGMVCPKIYFYPGNEFHRQSYAKSERGKVIWYMGGVIDWANVYAFHWGVDEVDHGQCNQATKTDFATGCCLAITRKTIDRIGLMDERYFLYYEDVDWSLRAKNAGFNIVVEPKSVIYHKNAGSTGGSGSVLQQYYQTRNRLYFGLKFAPLNTKLHLVRNALNSIISKHGTIRTANIHGLIHKLGHQPLPTN